MFFRRTRQPLCRSLWLPAAAAAGAAGAAVAGAGARARERRQVLRCCGSGAVDYPDPSVLGGRTSTSHGHRPGVKPLREPTVSEFTSFDTYIFDCDGVIWGIDEADTRSAVATINYLVNLGKRVMFVTNNSNKSRDAFVRQLEHKGVDFQGRCKEAKRKMVISASFTTASFLKEHGFSRPFVITSDTGVLEELRHVGITDYYATVRDDGTTRPEFLHASIFDPDGRNSVPGIVSENPLVDSVVVGWDHGLSARKIATAINYVKWHEDLNRLEQDYQPMLIVACSGDSGGVLGTTREMQGCCLKIRAMGNGPMAETVARSFDPPLPWIDCGKPSDTLLCLLRTAYEIDVTRTLMVGDTIQTDIVFGNHGCMTTLLVLSGVTTQAELSSSLLAGNQMRRPTYVLPTLGTLHDRAQLRRT